MSIPKLAQGSLVIRCSASGDPFYEAKWRDSARRQCKRRLGPAWLELGPDGQWRKQRGRLQEGFLNERSAHVAMRDVVAAHEEDLRERPEARELTFGRAADAWLVHLGRTGGAKPSTLRDYKAILDRPRLIRDKKPNAARIMRRFDASVLGAVRTRDIEDFLDSLDKAGLSARNINKHRQVLHSIYTYAQERFGVRENPVTAAGKRREDPPGALDYYSPEGVHALARAARAGKGREGPVSPDLDTQDAALFAVAAFTGLRLGELLALRWRHVDFTNARISVREALSAGKVSSPKSNSVRVVPLADQPARELDRLSERGSFTGRDDLVFCSPAGGFLDGSAVRRRYRNAQKAAVLRPLRFHDLRHTFGSLAVRQMDLVTVQAILGHSKLSTTQRYLHFKPRHDDAAQLTSAFQDPPTPRERGVQAKANVA